MLGFVRRNFRKWFTVALWIIVIGSTLGGFVLGWFFGKTLNNSDNVLTIVFFIIGGPLGLLIGLFTVVTAGGMVATFLNIDENLEILVQNQNRK